MKKFSPFWDWQRATIIRALAPEYLVFGSAAILFVITSLVLDWLDAPTEVQEVPIAFLLMVALMIGIRVMLSLLGVDTPFNRKALRRVNEAIKESGMER